MRKVSCPNCLLTKVGAVEGSIDLCSQTFINFVPVAGVVIASKISPYIVFVHEWMNSGLS